jgi:ribonuclease BN (tRNA processing enzyme)
MTATVTVLGSGTLIPDHNRHPAAFLVAEGGARVLFDCGAGVLDGMSRFGVGWADLTHIALSHFHTDHIGGLAPLMFALSHGVATPRTAPLALIGPPGLRRLLEALADAYGGYVLDPGFELSVVELARNDRWSDGTIDLRTCETVHSEHSVAYRWAGRAGTIGYTGDTGPSEVLGDFLAGSDLLITECSHPDPSPVDLHLTPSGVADLARQVAPDLVVTTHVYPTLPHDDIPELVRQSGYDGRVLTGYDGMCVVLEEGVQPSVR